MECVLLGWPPDGPTLRLDYRRFAYAGKFVMTTTGKAVIREEPVETTDSTFDEDVPAAVAFNRDRTDPGTLWLRYVTVRSDRRGEGLAPDLVVFVVDRVGERGYDCVRIAVNNPFAYEALYKCGFAWNGDETGIAELVLERPIDDPTDRAVDVYCKGFDRFLDRDLSAEEIEFCRRKRNGAVPSVEA